MPNTPQALSEAQMAEAVDIAWDCSNQPGDWGLDTRKLAYALIQSRAEVERLREYLKVAEMAFNNLNHAKDNASWFTHGEAGARQIISMWLKKGNDAVTQALAATPAQDNQQGASK